MTAETHCLAVDGAALAAGYWLCVWDITAPDGSNLVLVGQGEADAPASARSPVVRMIQELGSQDETGILRKNLEERGVDPQHCAFRLVAFGPMFGDGERGRDAQDRRELIAAIEAQLAADLEASGYEVLNRVDDAQPVYDEEMYSEVVTAFAEQLPGLLTALRREIDERLSGLAPAVHEYYRLKAAASRLGDVPKAGRGSGKAGRRKGSGQRAAEVLALVGEHPGITIPELAAGMGIRPNYLYRVVPGLAQEGRLVRRGKGWSVP